MEKSGTILNFSHHMGYASYMSALDVSIGKQNVLGIRNRPEKPLMVGIISCYKVAVDIKLEKRVLLFLFRTPFFFRYHKILWFEVLI